MFEPTAIYAPNPHRYDTMTYNRAGTSGLKLPAVSLGFWHNFGDQNCNVKGKTPIICRHCFPL